MPFRQEKIAAANQAALDTLLAYSSTALGSTARLVALNFETAQSVLADGTNHLKALLGAHDLPELQSLHTSAVQPGIEKSVGYLRSIQELAHEAQEQLHSVVETQFGEIQKQTSELIDQAARHAPAGSDAAIAGARSALSAVHSAFGNLNSVARQVSDIAEANIAAAGSATARAVAPASAGKKKAA